MKRLKWLAAGLAILALPMLAWTAIAHGQYIGNYVDQNQVVNSSVYSGSKDVTIHGTINGDVFCAGQTVTVDATVHGDVICAGMDVTIAGKVDGNVRAAGQTVAVSGEVARNLTVASANFSLDAGAKIQGDATLAGTLINLKGQIGRDAVITGSNAIVNGSVLRNVQYYGENLSLKNGANVGGDLTYTGKNNATVDHSARVLGQVTHKLPQNKKPAEQPRRSMFGVSIFGYLYCLAALGLIALALVLFFPSWVNGAGLVAQKRFGMALLVGFLTHLLAPIVGISLMITVIGIPLALALMVVWLALIAISGPLAAYWLGKVILQKRATNSVGVMALGSLVLITLFFVPFIGVLIVMVAVWLGTGTVLMYLKARVPKPHYKLEDPHSN